jgi:hypothetical protein
MTEKTERKDDNDSYFVELESFDKVTEEYK